jgi:hypothetical protein
MTQGTDRHVRFEVEAVVAGDPVPDAAALNADGAAFHPIDKS